MNRATSRRISQRANRRSPRVGQLIALVVPIAVGIAACGVPAGGDTFERIEDDDVLFGLAEPSTTAPTTTAAPTTASLIPQTTTAPTTEMPPPPTETVDIYFISPNSLRPDILRPVPQEIRAGVTSEDLILSLEEGPDDASSPPLDNEISRGLIRSVEIRGGVANVDLNDSAFGRIGRGDERNALAQIVLTLLDNLTGVGQVQFTFDGEQRLIPTGQNFFTDEPVAFEDYANLLADSPPTPEPTDTAAPSDTSVPDTPVPTDDSDRPADTTETTAP